MRRMRQRGQWMVIFSMFGLLCLGVVGCAGTSPSSEVSVKLQAMAGCSDVVQNFRAVALADMNEKIDKAIASFRSSNDESCWNDSAVLQGAKRTSSQAPSPAPTTAPGSPTEGGAKQVSTTNNQVAGVDEADFIKNDNKYIYIVANGRFRILKAWPAAETKVIANVALEGTPKKLFVHNNRAMIYASLTKAPAKEENASRWGRFYNNQSRECTYGYNCSFSGDGKPMLISVFNIEDRTAPKLLRQVKTSGSYLNARRIGDAVFTVVTSPAIQFPRVTTHLSSLRCGKRDPKYIEQIVAQYEALRKINTTIIQTAEIKDWLPMIEETDFVEGKASTLRKPLGECQGFYRTSRTKGGQFTTVLSLDLQKVRAVHTTTIVSPPGAVYASDTALYMSVPQQRQAGYGWYRNMAKLDEASTIHKFGLFPKQAAAFYAASGVVKGRVLNQFAMDEYKSHLRIATTTGRLPSPKVHSTLSVLVQKEDVLVQVGQVDGLGPKEDIRSVRFSGERGYIVTFKKTDPLFVLDLSKPASPSVMAELKIPGFSTYMQMMDENHLLSIGYDADEQGSFAYFTGVLLQIFDVSDPKNPKRVHREVIGTRGSSSEALTNHLAFTYFAPKQLLAIPMTLCTGTAGGGRYGKNMEFSGLMVFDVTAKGGFKVRGKVPHPTGQDISCSNWWTNAKSQVKRSIIMDDYVFSVSNSLIKVNHIQELTTDLASIPLQ